MSDQIKDSKDKQEIQKHEEQFSAENNDSDSDLFNWILDKGWLRTKK